MKRATEDHIVKAKEGVNLEGARLTTFLLNVQEYDAAAAKLGRRLREPGLVEILAESGLEKKTDFEDKKALEKLLRKSKKPSSSSKARSPSTRNIASTNSVWSSAQPENQLGRCFDCRVQAPARPRQADRGVQPPAVHRCAQWHQGLQGKGH